MNYKGSLHIINGILVGLLFLFLSCTTQRAATPPTVSLVPINSNANQKKQYELRLDYVGLQNCNYEFKVFIANQSKDSIFVTPDSLRYSFISKDNEIFHSISPEERSKQLKIQKNKLKNEKNPYSLSSKSIREVVTEGFIQGAIAYLFGQDPEELEEQREQDEDDWQRKHDLKLVEIKKKLNFWNNSVLLPGIIAPQEEVTGKILFPVYPDAQAIKIEIPVQDIVYNFRFKQTN